MVDRSSGMRIFLLLTVIMTANALNLKSSILPQLKRGDTISESVMHPRDQNLKVSEAEEKLDQAEEKAPDPKDSKDSKDSKEEEEESPEDPGGPPTVVDLDSVDWGSKLKHFFKKEKEKKYAFVTMYLNESLVNETLDDHPRIMTYEQAKEEAFDRWLRIMQAGGQSTKHPPADLYKNVQSRHSHPRKGKRTGGVKGILHLADSLRRVGSKYPLVVVTNEPSILQISLKHHPNLILIPWTENFMHHTCHMYFMNTLHFQKLKIFNMTDFEKLMWLDTDLEIRKNFDELFALDTQGGKHIYGQIDDYWMCKDHNNVVNHKKTAYGFCSGMMLFEPTEEAFKGLLHQQSKMANNVCWGDQSLIQAYFGKERVSLHGENGREIKLLGKKTVSFPYCASNDTAVIHYSDPQS